MMLALDEHENLYQESVRQDLDGLSENLASDLVAIMATDPDDFELTALLLRLDQYRHVKRAVVFDVNWQIITSYVGSASTAPSEPHPENLVTSTQNLGTGIHIFDSSITAIKTIGDNRLPVGYLYIENDLQAPLKQSKQKMLWQVLPTVVLSSILVLFGSIWLLGTWVKPLSRLSRFVTKVDKTRDYSLRPNVEGSYEISRLSSDIGRMMETIDEESAKNQQYTSQLIQQQKAMEKLANYDGLTGLPNRQFFMQSLSLELAKAVSAKSDLVLLFLDLDGFKGVNDAFGHEVGDKLLVKIANRVKAILRDGDLISRLGGDEFLILMPDNPSDYIVDDVAKRIINDIQKELTIDDLNLKVSASIGIAHASQSNFSISEFLSNADLAMYRSKLDGKGKYTKFVESMMRDNKRKLQIASAIDKALKLDQFTLYYQPRVDKNQQIQSYEVLLRWIDDDLGFVSPAEFIPIAEQSGKITRITLWVIRQLCIEFPKLQGLHLHQVKVSVNLSALDIKRTDMIEQIEKLFKHYDMAASLVEFEVTESSYLENFDVANKFLGDIRAMGSQIALDDFGTGYSSLAYLTQININTLKIDKQFVDNLGLSERSDLVTKAIIDMAKRLQLKICAEGVETVEQVELLILSGCDQFQGYYYGKPHSLAHLQALRCNDKT